MGDERDRLGFLEALGPALAEAFRTAERTAFDAPRLAYVALRGFAELLLSHPAIPTEVPRSGVLFDRLEVARRNGLLPTNVVAGLDALRRDGNIAAHAEPTGREPEHSIEELLRVAWTSAAWVHRQAGGREEDVPVFRPPTQVDSAMVFRDALLGGHLGGGDPKAKYYVAVALLDHMTRMRDAARTSGHGMSLNRRAEAEELLRDAVHFVPAARSTLADLLLASSPVPSDHLARALELLEWGCEDEDPGCLFRLGLIRFDGQYGQTADWTVARTLFERAASHEHPGALHALAVHYTSGIAVDSDPESARVYARRAAEAGDPLGQDRYGCMLVEGRGGAVDGAEGATWIRRAIRQQCGDAAWHLYQHIRGGRVAAAPDESLESLLDSACSLGSAEALLHCAQAFLKGAETLDDLERVLGYVGATEDLPMSEEQIALASALWVDARSRMFSLVQAVADSYAEGRAPCHCGSGRTMNQCHSRNRGDTTTGG